MSQPRKATPTTEAPVSPVKPAQFEKESSASGIATMPGGLTTATGSAAVGATVKGAPKETAPVSQVKATSTALSPATIGATGATSTAGVAAAGSAAVTKPKESPKATVQSATVTAVKAEPAKVDPAKVGKLAATAAVSGGVSVKGKTDQVKPTQTKVQVEVARPEAKAAKEGPAVDPFDALASILPPSEPIAPEPVYTGPEVKEHGVTSKEGVLVGERDDTLPPGYRFEDLAPGQPDVKPKDVPKPMSTDEALESLSAGFMTFTAPTAPKKGEKMEKNVTVVDASSAGSTNFAPPPVQIKRPEVAVCSVPPADKKAKVDKAADDFSLMAGLPRPPIKAPEVTVCPTPPAEKKKPEVTVCPVIPVGKEAKVEKVEPKTDEGDPMSLEALSALGDTLEAPEPKPELPPLRPEDIISEDKLKDEKGVRVGERDETLPPEYRFTEDKFKDLPTPKPEPTMDAGEALDILSDDFMTPSAAPLVQAPVVTLPAPPAPQCEVEELSALDALTADFVAPVKASGAQAPIPPCAKKPEIAVCDFGFPKPIESKKEPEIAVCDFGSLMPIESKKEPEIAVCDFGFPKPIESKREPEIAVCDFGSLMPIESKKEPEIAVCDFGFPTPIESKKQPEIAVCDFGFPKPIESKNEPEIAVCDFGSLMPIESKKEPEIAVCDFGFPMPIESKKEPEIAVCDFGGPCKPNDIIPAKKDKTPAKTPKPTIDEGDSMSLDALSALGDTLAAPEPKPEPAPLRPEDIVSEDKLKDEKGVRVGDRDDALPPEYRFTEDKLKDLPAPKPAPTMDTSEALSILSGDFMTSSAAPAVQAARTPFITPSAPPAQPCDDFALDDLVGDFITSSAASTAKSAAPAAAETSHQLSTGTEGALDALSDTLMDTTSPVPEPAPVPVKDIVKEKKVVEEKLIKMGEKDDTIPPEYRPTEEDRKAMAEAKAKEAAKPKKKPLGDKEALDLLSSDFSAAPMPAVSAVPSAAATTELKPPVLDSQPLQPMAGPVLDSLASTLLPDAPEFRQGVKAPQSSKADKPKGKSKSRSKSKKHQQATEDPSAFAQPSDQLSTDVVSTSTKKGGKS